MYTIRPSSVPEIEPDLLISRNDLLPPLVSELTGLVDPLPTGTQVRLWLRPRNGGTSKVLTGRIISHENHIVQCDWLLGDTATAGDYDAAWRLTFPDGSPMSFPTDTKRPFLWVKILDGQA
jgi:hypothetical protein